MTGLQTDYVFCLDMQLLLAVHELEQQDHALITFIGLKDGVYIGEGSPSDSDLVAGEQGMNTRTMGHSLSQGLHHFFRYRLWLAAKGHHTSYTSGGAQGVPVIHLGVHIYEEITGKKRLTDELAPPLPQTLNFEHRQIAVITLIYKVFFGAQCLPRLALQQIPGRPCGVQ